MPKPRKTSPSPKIEEKDLSLQKINMPLYVVSSEVAYQEMYQEMRRYRDYELSVSTWYTALLLAILGGVFTAKFGDFGLSQFFDLCAVKSVTIFVVILIGGSGMWSVHYAHQKYSHIKKYIFNEKLNLEPDWKKKYKPQEITPKPRHLILLTQLILVALSLAVVFWPL